MISQVAAQKAVHARGERAPGPRGRPIVGSIPEFQRDPVGFLTRAVAAHGDFVELDLARKVYLLNHPDFVQHVLHDRHTAYKKSFVYQRMRPLVGNGLLTSEGDFWKRQRRLSQPAFHRQRIAGFAQLMARRTDEMLQAWEPSARSRTPLDVHAEMMGLTLAIVGDALFSVDLRGQARDVGEALSTALEITNQRFQALFLFPSAIPTPQNVRFNRAMRVLNGLVDGIIADRRKSPGMAKDLLGMLMEMRDADTGETMTDAQLRDEVMTMVLAGHETTANALAWAFYLLSKNPTVARSVRQDIHTALGGRTPGVEDLPRLGSLDRVIQEAMRLYPPAWLIGREALEDDVINGYPIPAGTAVVLCAYTTHRHPEFWPNPEGFDPDRFLPENAARRPKLAYFPFAAGPRMCIGNTFAMMEMQVILAMILQRYSLELLPGFQAELDPNVTLRPRHGIPMSLRIPPAS